MRVLARKYNTHCQLLVAASALTACGGVLADATQRQLTNSLEEVIVTAQKREERLKDVPISISVLGGNDLDRSSILSVTDALKSVPGLDMTVGINGGGMNLSIRGVGATEAAFSGSSPVGYYLDSVPMSQIRQGTVPDFNAFDLDRIEVLKGPQGTLYGANAQNGLVRVLTRDPDLEQFEFKARTTFSNTKYGAESYRGDMAVNVPLIDGKLGARAVVGYEDRGGWIDSPNDKDVNGALTRNYRLKIGAQPTEALSIGLSAWRSNQDRGADSLSRDDRTTTAILPQSVDVDTEMYGLRIAYDFTGFTLASMTSYIDTKSDGILDLFTLAPAPVFLGARFNTVFSSKTFAQEMLANSNSDGPWRWTAGLFYRDASDRQFQTLPAIAYFADLLDDSKSYALFGQFGRRFADGKLEWALGGRYFHETITSKSGVFPRAGQTTPFKEEEDSHATTPRAVLTWYPNKEVTLYGSYSEGFRGSISVGYVAADTALAQGLTLPVVKPDKLRNYELGVKADAFDGRVSVESAVYYMDWQDVQQVLQIPLPVGTGTVRAITNGTSASGVGVDFALTARPVRGLNIGVSASWNDLTHDSTTITNGSVLFNEGDRLNLSPEYTAGASADYEFPLGGSLRARFGVSGNYIPSKTMRVFGVGPTVVQPSDDMLLAGVHVVVESADDRWVATLFADNVTNWDGRATPSRSDGPLVGRQRPRTVGLQLDFRL
jgi:iron complex outermembrane recepter protein